MKMQGIEGEGMDSLEQAIQNSAKQVVLWRRHLHEHPELAFCEYDTSQFVYDTLQSFSGLLVSRPTKTSVMARLIGKRPGKVVAFRADMDALPIQEENDFPFASKNPGVMHACGHDGHTAILLATASVLCQFQHVLTGEVRFLFQHAEELFPGGAKEMVAAGVMRDVDVVVGAHLWSTLPVGQVALASGPLMAAPDTFEITVLGQGGHAADPHETIDPIVIGAQIVTNLQQIVSRSIDPFDPLVVSVTQFHAGTADNVIPKTAKLVGTVRSFDLAMREQVADRMEQITKGICVAHGADYCFAFHNGYRPVINDPQVTNHLEQILISSFGRDAIVKANQTMGGEDFSAFLQAAPGAFFFIGAANPEKGITFPHHHPRFTVDEDALLIGVKAYVQIAFALGKHQS